MSLKHPRKTIWRAILCLVSTLVICVSIPALAQGPQKIDAQLDSVPVVIDGKQLFTIHGPEGDSTAQERAEKLAADLDKLIDDHKFQPTDLSVTDAPSSSAIVNGTTPLVTITQQDADAEGATIHALAQKRFIAMKSLIESERARRNFYDAINQVKPGAFKSNLLYLMGNPLLLRIGIGLLGLLIIVLITYSLRRSIPKYFHESYKRYTISKLAEFSSYFIALVFLTVVFSDTLSSLAVILGAATAGIALALKELIVSMAAWLAITFGETYRVGDRVQIGGVKGDVIDIGLVRTTLMELGEWVQGDLYTGRIVRVANGSIFQGPTFNYTRDLPFLWDEVVIPLKYDSDAQLAREVIQRVVDEVIGDYVLEAKTGWEKLKEKYLVEDERIDPLVTLTLTREALEYTIRYPVDFRQRRSVKDELFTCIQKEIAQSDGKIKLGKVT